MYPFDARGDFRALESAVATTLADHFASAPNVIAAELALVKPRLVFGQHALAEAIRSYRDSIDPPTLECAKLLAYQRSLSHLLSLGPTELVYEQGSADQLVFGVRTWGSGERLGELRIARTVLDDSARLGHLFAASHADLFCGLYISAIRYLL